MMVALSDISSTNASSTIGYVGFQEYKQLAQHQNQVDTLQISTISERLGRQQVENNK